MRTRLLAWFVPAAIWLALASPSAAQDAGADQGTSTGAGQGTEAKENPLTRPFRGLFGLGDSERTGMDLSGSLFGAYDENLAGTLPGQLVDPRLRRSGWYAGANARFSFNWRGERSSANGFALGGGNYYPDTNSDFAEPFVPNYSVGGGFTRRIGERNSARISQTVLFSPYYLAGFGPETPSLDDPSVTPPSFDSGLIVSGERLARYATRAEFSRQLSRQSSVFAAYAYNFTDYNDVSRRFTQQLMSAGFRRQLTRHANLRLGYTYRTVTNDVNLLGATSFHRNMHDFDVGIDYNRALTLSMSRRTTVSFSTGSSFVTSSNFSESVGSDSPSRLYLTGNAELAHEIGRTWRAALAYRRSIGFTDIVLEPVTSDGVIATLSGLIGRRNEVSVSASASRGRVGTTTRQNNDYTNYLARAEWRRALTRHLATEVSYFYYDHDFGRSVLLPLSFPYSVRRNGVRVGLTAWLPLR